MKRSITPPVSENQGLGIVGPVGTAAENNPMEHSESEFPASHTPAPHAMRRDEMMARHHGAHADGASQPFHPAHDAYRAVSACCHHDAISAHAANGGTRR
jgi:hypothetical protein